MEFGSLVGSIFGNFGRFLVTLGTILVVFRGPGTRAEFDRFRGSVLNPEPPGSWWKLPASGATNQPTSDQQTSNLRTSSLQIADLTAANQPGTATCNRRVTL